MIIIEFIIRVILLPSTIYQKIKQTITDSNSPSQYVLIEREIKGNPISPKNEARFTPKQWQDFRDEYLAEHEMDVLIHYAETGRLPSYEESVKAFNFTGPKSCFPLDKKTSWSVGLAGRKIRDRYLKSGTVYSAEEALAVLKEKVGFNEKVIDLNQFMADHNEMAPARAEEFRIRSEKEAVIRCEKKELAEKEAAAAEVLRLKKEESDRVLAEQIRIQQELQVKLDAEKPELEPEYEDDYEEEKPSYDSSSNFKHKDRERNNYLKNTGGFFDDQVNTVHDPNLDFPFPVEEDYYDRSLQKNVKYERDLISSGGDQWVYTERYLESPNNGLSYSLKSTTTKYAQKSRRWK